MYLCTHTWRRHSGSAGIDNAEASGPRDLGKVSPALIGAYSSGGFC